MLHTLNVGDRVKVWPRPGLKVQSAPPSVIETPVGVQVLPGKPLADSGEEVVWSEWLQEMARQGAVVFSDPSKSYVVAEHVNPLDEKGKE